MSPGAGRFEQTYALAELARELVQGRGDPAALEANLALRLQGVEQLRQGLAERARLQGPEFLERASDDLATVFSHLDRFHETLAEMRAFLEDRQTIHLARGSAQIEQLLPELGEALDRYSALYMSFGPSRFPMCNFLLKACEGLHRGELDPAWLKSLADQARTFFTQALAEVEGAEKASPGMRQAILELMSAVDELGDRVDRPDELEPCAARVELALMALEKAHELYLQERVLTGPTASPQANLAIGVLGGLQSGAFGPELARQVLDWFHAGFQAMRRDVEQMLNRAEGAPAILLEELPKTLDAMDLVEEAIEQLQSLEGLESGIEALIEAVARLDESRRVYDEAAEREAQVLCPRCLASNFAADRVCAACSAALPHFDVAWSTFETREGTEERVVTTHVARIFLATQDYFDGKSQLSDFLGTLDWAEGLLRQAERQLTELPIAEPPPELSESELEEVEEHQQLLGEVLETMREGLAEFQAGLDLLRSYPDDPQRAHLEEGIRQVFEGSIKIRRMQLMSEAAARLEEEEAEEELPAPEGEDSYG